MNQPAVTVLMPVHNGGGFLRAAIESILAQRFSDFELLIVDDCSTDETSQVLSAYDEPRLTVIRNKEQMGVSRSLNRGLQSARAPWIARMDADDIAEPERLQKQVTFLQDHPRVIVCGTAGMRIDERGLEQGIITRQTTDAQIRFQLLTGNPFLHSSVVYRRDVVLRRGGYDENYSSAQDYDLWCRLAPDGSFANLPEKLIRYRSHSHAVSAAQRDEQLAIHVRRSQQHLLETGVAKTIEEARVFQSFSGLGERGVPVPVDRQQWARYVKMVDAFFAMHRTSTPEATNAERDCRARLRRRFLQRAQRAGWLSRLGLRYVWLARQIDPEGMRMARLGSRAVRDVFRRVFTHQPSIRQSHSPTEDGVATRQYAAPKQG